MATQEDVTSSVNAAPETTARYIRVTVVDHAREGRPAVTVKMPLGVAKWGLLALASLTLDEQSE